MKLRQLHLSVKFYLGFIFILGSILIGKVTQFTFLYYYDDTFIRWTSAVIYILSWAPFIIGIIWVGREYADAIQRYFSYKFYHESVKKGVRKSVELGAHFGKKVVSATRSPKISKKHKKNKEIKPPSKKERKSKTQKIRSKK